MVVEGGDLEIGMVQIASRLVRRIVPFVAEGQMIPQGSSRRRDPLRLAGRPADPRHARRRSHRSSRR